MFRLLIALGAAIALSACVQDNIKNQPVVATTISKPAAAPVKATADPHASRAADKAIAATGARSGDQVAMQTPTSSSLAGKSCKGSWTMTGEKSPREFSYSFNKDGTHASNVFGSYKYTEQGHIDRMNVQVTGGGKFQLDAPDYPSRHDKLELVGTTLTGTMFWDGAAWGTINATCSG